MASITCTGFAFFVATITCELPPQPTAIVCPPLVEWQAQDQQAAGQALAALPAAHPLRKMGMVALKQRDVVKRCKTEQAKTRRYSGPTGARQHAGRPLPPRRLKGSP